MAKKRPLNGRKKNEDSGINLDRSEGCRGARTGMTRRAPMAREDANRNRALEETGLSKEGQVLVELWSGIGPLKVEGRV